MAEDHEKVLVRIQSKDEIYIHNDLANAAHYYVALVGKRIEAGDREGIAFDMTAGLVMVAFALEAKFNFLGWRLIEKWDERQPYMSKVEAVCAKLAVPYDLTTRPLSSVARLYKFRNEVAHGKPQVIPRDETLEMTRDDLEKRRGVTTSAWEHQLSLESLGEAYEDMNVLWHEMLARADIEVFETLTQSESLSSVLGSTKAGPKGTSS